MAENLGLGYIASFLRKNGYEVRLIDGEVLKLSPSQIAKTILRDDFAFVGFSIPDPTVVESVKATILHLRRSGYNRAIILGGNFATYNASTLLSKTTADLVVTYEGENTVLELAKRIESGKEWEEINGVVFQNNNGQIVTKTRGQIVEDIDPLPFPARDSLSPMIEKYSDYQVSLISSRGCFHKCSFCVVPDFFGTWRARTPSNVVDELEQLVREYRVSNFEFHDSNFVGSGERGRHRSFEIAEEILRRKLNIRFRILCSPDTVEKKLFMALHRAGLYGVNIGIESGVQSALNYFKKGTTVEQNKKALQILKELDILHNSTIGFIMFHPQTTMQEVRRNISFLRNYMKYISPVCLTNILEPALPSFEDRQLDFSINSLKEDVGNLYLAFGIINAHTVDSYLSIQKMGDREKKKFLSFWKEGILKLAEEALKTVSKITGLQKQEQTKEIKKLFYWINTKALNSAKELSRLLGGTKNHECFKR